VRLERTQGGGGGEGGGEELFQRKRDKMRRWLCCTCQVEESYPPYESERLRSPRNNGDGKLF